MTELLKRIILENQEMLKTKKIISRNITIPHTDHITVITGIRRCGKTHLLYEIASVVETERILFIDFEDERLLGLMSVSNYDIIVDSYKALYPDMDPVIFFDEIQVLPHWHLYLKRLHVKGYKVYVTGSNANMISREIATHLKGHSLETTIYPFTFQEFLKLKNIEIHEKDQIINTPMIVNLFTEYLTYGSFPEVINASIQEKRAVSQNIYNLLFYKDIVAKYEKDPYLLKLIVSKITENITKEFSITSIANKIIPIHKTTVPTVTDYFSILPDPFLTFNIYPYRNSFVQRESKRKTYLADNSFVYLNRVSTDYSRLFENLVYTTLLRQYDEIFYYRTTNNKEVDFYIPGAKKQRVVQACFHFENEDTKDREIKALFKAMFELGLKTGYIYTMTQNEEIISGNKKIIILPLWKECLKS